MFTLSYPFRPWSGSRAIADGASILDYLRATAREHGIDERIRYHHRVVAAEWSSEDARWTVEVERGDTGETLQLTCAFLFTCTGYYRYDEGYTPAVRGRRALRRRDRASAVLARGRRLRRQARGGDRQRRHRRDAHPRARRAGPPRHDAAALAQLRPLAAGGSTRSRACSGVCCRPGSRIRSCAGRTCCSRSRSSASAAAGPRGCGGCCARPRCAGSRTASTSTRTSTRATTRGTSACASRPTATSSTRSAPAASRSSPTASRRSPRPASRSRPAPSSRPT